MSSSTHTEAAASGVVTAAAPETSPAFPELSPMGPDSLHPSPQASPQADSQAEPRTDVVVSALTTNLDEPSRLTGSSSSSCGDGPVLQSLRIPAGTAARDNSNSDGTPRHPHDGGTPDTRDRMTPDSTPGDGRTVMLGRLAEEVRSTDVLSQCDEFGDVERVYMPRRRPHPCFGMTAFVTFRLKEAADETLAAFRDAGFDARLTEAPQSQKKRRGRGGRRGSTASMAAADPRARPPLTVDELKRRGEARRATGSRPNMAAPPMAPPPQ